MFKRRMLSSSVMRTYVLKEFFLSFAVAFLFFFFIFFVNQLLLFAQRILLKRVEIVQMLTLVGLSIPQILMYTIPFSTLSAASMVIGDLSARNELLAFRSLGISLRKVFIPIAFMAFFLSILTFIVADFLIPYSNQQYRILYAELLRELPTMELDSFSVNRVGGVTLVTQEVKEGKIESLILFEESPSAHNRVISASGGSIQVIDLQNFIYRLELNQPLILSTHRQHNDDFVLSEAEKMIYYLDFSSQVSRFTDVTPSQLSSRDLLQAIEGRKEDLYRDLSARNVRTYAIIAQQALVVAKLEQSAKGKDLIQRLVELERELIGIENQRRSNFYLQYYRAELHKKIALSASCFVLVFIAFPLSLARLKHGRLFGFGLSLLVACIYWFMLFFAQTQILRFDFNPAFLMWAPNVLIGVIASLLLFRMRRI